MGLKSIVKKALKYSGATLGLKVLGSLLTSLLPVPKIPKSVEQSGTQYNAEARINASRLGDVKAVVYGQCRVWPAYCSMPYTYFEGHDQILAAYLHITVGYANVLDIRIGDTSATRFPGFEYEVCLPGEDMTLIRPDVYTNPEVKQIELLGGLLSPQKPSDGSGRVTIDVFTDDTVIFDSATSTITADEDGLFEGFAVNDLIGVYDSNLNEDYDYTITAISDDFKKLDITPPPVDEVEPESGYFVRQRWAGPYPACQPGATVHTVAFDFVFASLRDEDMGDDLRSVIIVIQCRPIDDVGTPTGSWEEAEFTFTDNVNRARRYTVDFIVDTPARYEGRCWRKTYEQADSEDPSSALTWVGLKGYIVTKSGDAPASDALSTRIAVKIRSSGLLAGQSENAVNCMAQRLLPVYESGGWTDPQITRSPAWASVDWLTNHSRQAVPLASLTVDSFLTSAETADTNGDTFDAVFDRQVGLWEGAQTILRVARSKPILNPLTRLYEVYRDEPSDPIVMVCDGFNARLGSDTINLPDADTVTGVLVTFMDPLLWTEREGPTVGLDDDPRKVRFMGCTSWDNAWREASYEYRDLYYRNHSVSAETEMDGLIPIHGNRVLVASAMKGWGHSGEVVEEIDALNLKVWPAPVWTPGMDHYIYLQDADGQPVGPINVTQGGAVNYLVLESDPGITIRVGGSWKTLFAFGHGGDSGENPDAPRIAIVQSRSANSLRTATLDLLFDHPFVHEDPGPAPEDPYDTDGTIPDLTVNNLAAEQVITGDVLLDPDGEPLLDPDGEFLIAPGGEEAGVVVNVTWDAVAGATVYKLRWRYLPTGPWSYITTTGTSATFAVPTNGNVRVRVKAESTSYVGTESLATVTIDAY